MALADLLPLLIFLSHSGEMAIAAPAALVHLLAVA